MRRQRITLLVCTLLAAMAAVAQQSQPRPQSAADVLRSIQQSSGDVEQLRANLHSPDPSVRISTFTAMINSNNPAFVAVAINEGHVSSDAAIQDLAARVAFHELNGFQVEPSGEVSPDAQNSLFFFAGSLHVPLDRSKYDWGSGTFTINNGQGQISGSHLGFRYGYCQGNLAAVPGSWTYEGLIVCVNGGQKLTSRMHVTIR